MNRLYIVAMLVAMALPGGAMDAVRYDFTRYQPILDREPFGAAPVAPTAEELMADRMADTPPPFVKKLRMCAITETEEFGLRVGIVDISAKPPTSYMMRVGEVQDELELVDADFDREGALLKKEGVMHWIYLDGSLGSGPGGAQTTVASPSPGGPRVPPSAAARSSSGRGGSYAERLKKRREILEERRRKSEERASVGPEALKKQLQEYQMELIRAGGELGPPLPIPLTKEMDNQLVAEGALPALK